MISKGLFSKVSRPTKYPSCTIIKPFFATAFLRGFTIRSRKFSSKRIFHVDSQLFWFLIKLKKSKKTIYIHIYTTLPKSFSGRKQYTLRRTRREIKHTFNEYLMNIDRIIREIELDPEKCLLNTFVRTSWLHEHWFRDDY